MQNATTQHKAVRVFPLNRFLLGATLILFLSSLAWAAFVNVLVVCPGGGPSAFPSISAAVAALDPNDPNTITVTGTCSDNIFIAKFHNLFIESAPGQTATIAPTRVTAPQTSSSSIDVKSRMEEGVAAFRAHDYKLALSIFNEVTVAEPSNIRAHNLAGNCSLEMRDFPAAIRSFQRALQLQPDQPQSLAGLIGSYAQAGMIKERDATLERLHELSKADRLPANFFYTFDSFAVGNHSVLVTEFPQLAGHDHFRYQFDVYDATGKFASSVALESDDVDQTSWAKRHPKEAAAGGRAFSLDGYSQTVSGQFTHSLYKFYHDGEPPYVQVRADVEKVLAEGLEPVTSSTIRTTTQPSASPSPQP